MIVTVAARVANRASVEPPRLRASRIHRLREREGGRWGVSEVGGVEGCGGGLGRGERWFRARRSRGASRDRSRGGCWWRETFVDSVFARGPRGRTRDSPGGRWSARLGTSTAWGGGTRPTRSPRMSTPSRFGTRVPPRRAMRRRRRPASSLAHARPVLRGRGRGGSPERARETRRERRRSFAARAPLSLLGRRSSRLATAPGPGSPVASCGAASRVVPFSAGRLPSRARCGAGDGFRNPRRSGKTRV